jgi:predicted membrane protein
MRLSFLGVGTLLVALGAIIILGQADVLDAEQLIGDWWPLALVWLAALQWLSRPREFIGPLIVATIGVVLLGSTADLFGASPAIVILAVILIVIGGVVIRSALRDRKVISHTPSSLDSFVAFGGRELVSRADPFEAASLTSVFAGTSLDLSEATLGAKGASVGTLNVFAGTDITVPRDWKVELRVTPIMGGVADETEYEPRDDDIDRTIVIDGVSIFGGVDIKNPDRARVA